MLFQTVGQYRVFLWMLAAGALTGAWYGCMAALRRALSAGLWLGLLTDIAFGLGAAAIFCAALYTANYGAFRLYALLASALGFMIFAAGVFPMGRRVITKHYQTICQNIVKIKEIRWIKVIFR